MDKDNRILEIYDSVNELPPAAARLLRHEQSPFLDYNWFKPFSDYVCPALGAPKWLLLSEEGVALALLPMIALKRGQYRVLQSMSNYYSPYYDVISSTAISEVFLAEIFRKAKSFLKDFDIIEFLPVTEEVKNRFINVWDHKGWSTHVYDYSTNWRERGITDFSTYWDSRPSKLKSTIQRKYHKLEKLEYEFKIFTDELPDQALADYHRIYFKSWKRNEPFPNFIDEVARNASANNSIRLSILYIEGQPAAAQFWILRNNTAYIIKLAYDPDFNHLSVGSLLSHQMFKYVIQNDKAEIIDYLTGNDAYKEQWVSSRRPLFGLQISNTQTFTGWTVKLRNLASSVFHNSSY